MRKTCNFFSVLHLVAVSLATVTSSFVIESIIGSGLACMVIALIALPCALIAKRYWLAASSFLTLLIGAFFIVFELVFFMFGGPRNAALPLCLLFLGCQAFSIFATTADLSPQSLLASAGSRQISLKQLLVGTGIFALSLGVMENIPTEDIWGMSTSSIALRYPLLISLSLAMFFFSVAGLFGLWKSHRSRPQ